MKTLNLEKWKKSLAAEKNAEILDVRKKDEYEEGHIEGAKLIDVENPQHFMDKINKLDKDQPYYVYCNSGNRGNQACLVMDHYGFKSLYNLEGGYQAWAESENS